MISQRLTPQSMLLLEMEFSRARMAAKPGHRRTMVSLAKTFVRLEWIAPVARFCLWVLLVRAYSSPRMVAKSGSLRDHSDTPASKAPRLDSLLRIVRDIHARPQRLRLNALGFRKHYRVRSHKSQLNVSNRGRIETLGKFALT